MTTRIPDVAWPTPGADLPSSRTGRKQHKTGHPVRAADPGFRPAEM